MRALLDANVLVAALLSRDGPPAQLLGKWLAGEFELIVSGKLVAELETAIARPKFRDRVGAIDAATFLELLRSGLAERVNDSELAPARSRDPKDDYLIAAAAAAHATLVSGDAHLLEL